MGDTDVRPRSGIPLGHKVFAVVLAASVAGAGCGWLIYQSKRSASVAVLAFDPAVAQTVDAGLVSTNRPAVVLADSMLNDETVAALTKEERFASSTAADRIGEFRSALELTQPSAQRLEVRFQGADPSQSMAVTNAVAQVLAGWKPGSGNADAGLAETPSAGAAASPPAAQTAPDDEGQAHPAAIEEAASKAAPLHHVVPDHSLSDALRRLGAQLSATDEEVDRLAESGGVSQGSEQRAHSESSEQSIVRAEANDAQKTLRELRDRHAKEIADPGISAPLNTLQQAVDRILPGGRRDGFNAAGFSTSELNGERAELRKAVGVVMEETKNIRRAEDAASAAQGNDLSTDGPNAAQSAPNPSPAPSVSAQPGSSDIQERNIAATTVAGTAPQQSGSSPFSIVRPAAPASRPPLWPALAAGAFCGLLYFGIAALAYRRTGGGDPEITLAPDRMITFAEPIRAAEPAVVADEPAEAEAEPRPRAAFVLEPAPAQNADAAAEAMPAIAEDAAAPADSAEIAAEAEPAPAANEAIAAEAEPAPAEAVTLAPPVAAAEAPVDTGASPVASDSSMAETVQAQAEDPPAPGAAPRDGEATALGGEKESRVLAHIWSQGTASGNDPVAERLRKSIAETTIARMFDRPGAPAAENSDSSQHREGAGAEPLANSVSQSGK